MSENLVEYTEYELLTRHMVHNNHLKIKALQRNTEFWREKCDHNHVQIEHKRNEEYGVRTTYCSSFRCLVCGKQWREEGSK